MSLASKTRKTFERIVCSDSIDLDTSLDASLNTKIDGQSKPALRLRRVIRLAGAIATCVFLVAMPNAVWSMSANPGPVIVTQPDGQRVELKMMGSDRLWWYEDKNGYPVIHRNGRYLYQTSIDPLANAASATLEVGKVNPEDARVKKILYSERLQQKVDSDQAINAINGRTENVFANQSESYSLSAVSTTGTVRNLVILLRFANHVDRHLPTREDFDVLFNQRGGDRNLAPTGSIKDLYLENSYGQLAIESTISDWVTLPKAEQYYANGVSGLNDLRMSEAITEALGLADSSIDFSQFDVNGDGRIDSITIVHSGYAAEFGGSDQYGTSSENRIWSHKGSLFPNYVSAEGVVVDDYNINPALWSTSGDAIGRIGVIAHELGHFLGLPDLYDRDGGGSGIGSWGLMGNSWGFTQNQLNPPHFSAWSKIELGWMAPTVITQGDTYLVPEAEFNDTVFRVDRGFPDGEYLLIENRQPTGFESTMPQGGLIVWHIDESKFGNTEEGYPGFPGWPGSHYKVAVLQADGLYELEKGFNRGDSGDPYHQLGVNSLGPQTTPSTDSYQTGVLRRTGINIRSISASGSAMTFDLGFIPPEPTFISPAGGESYESGSRELVRWKRNGSSNDTRYDLDIASACYVPLVFSDGMESGDSQWTVRNEGFGSGWSIKATNPYEGAKHWFASNVDQFSNQKLTTASPLSIPRVNPVLSFWHSFDLETRFDGGFVEVSEDLVTWEDLGSRMVLNGYNGNLPTGQPIFTGFSGGYIKTAIDLSDFSGRDVYFRFRLSTDVSVGRVGWFVDRVAVTGDPDVDWINVVTDVTGDSYDWLVSVPPAPDYCFRISARNSLGQSENVISRRFSIEAPDNVELSWPAEISVRESERQLKIALTLDRPAITDIRFNMFSKPGSARAGRGQDFFGFGREFLIPAGNTEIEVIVVLLPDDVVEGNEYFTVELRNLRGASLPSSKRVSTITIVDDDAVPPPSGNAWSTAP